jgi:hypothetical protein
VNPDPTPNGLAHALRQVADEIPEPDLASTAWSRGRRARQRRHGGAGVLTILAVVGIWAGLPKEQPAPAPAGEGRVVVTAPVQPTKPTGLPTAPSVSNMLTAGCLQDRGWQASATEDMLSVHLGQDQVQADANAAIRDCAEALGLTTFDQGWPAFVGTEQQDQASVTIYTVYADVTTCLRENDLPYAPAPSQPAFADDVRDGYVDWHPYLSANMGKSLASAMRTCPMPGPP